jgi:hypothetical protein
MTTLNEIKLTKFVLGDDRHNAWTAIVTVESGEQILLSLSLEVATQMLGQLHAALLQASRQG